MKKILLILLSFLLFAYTYRASGQTITGAIGLCEGSTSPLTGSPSGGTWSSSSGAVSINPTGLMSGLTVGTSTITYTPPSMAPVWVIATVYPAPAAIAGVPAVCSLGNTTLSNSTSGGIWTSGSPSIATISSLGVVTGIAPGTSLISYTMGSTGCATSKIVTVNPLPAAISTVSSLTSSSCAGGTLSLSESTSGGIWSTSNVLIAPVNAAGVVTGLSVGTANITYSLPTGCSATQTVTINAFPSTITGTPTACVGSFTSLTSSPAGGVWSTSNVAVAPVDAAGIVTGVSAGTANIVYSLPTGCAVSRTVTINALPSTITGAPTVCMGSFTSLISFPTGGGWLSSNPSVGIVGPTSGFVTGIASGTTNITYTISNGCYLVKTVTVNSLPPAISGTTNICLGNSTPLSDALPGGTWSSSNPVVAPIDVATGIVTPGASAGTSLISYTIGTGCAATATVVVNSLPLPITGPATVCVGTSPAFSSPTPGGFWTSSATAIATVGAAPGSATLVTGISAGATLISYTTGPGCVTSTLVTVALLPYAGTLSGPAVICIGAPASLTPTVSGGAWTSSAPGIASVSGLGVVSGFGTGLATISYSVNNICGVDIATMHIAVNLPPAAISGSPEICGGTGTTLTDAVPGGTWSSSDVSIASIGSSTGTLSSSLSGGITVITYSFSSACLVTRNMTVDAAPSAIAGVTPLCQGGVIALTDALSGGTWTSSNALVAIISTLGGTTGSVTGIGPGTATITYGMFTGCMATATVTVNPLPTITTSATPSSCGGTYIAAVGGGVSYLWSPSGGLSCDTCATTVVTPSVTTTYTITGTSVLGCTSDVTVTVPGDRIYGHINFSATTPSSLGMCVWLLQYDPTDSSLIATDSTLTCLDGTTPFFEFDSKPSGSYMLKSRLLSSTPGTSGYIPTYGGSTANWFNGSTTVHSGSSDNQNITMIYGSLPSGGGSISGNVYEGAGKGTSGDVPVEGMLVYLKNAGTGEVLTYAYTNVLGTYSFPGLMFGTYIVYPENFSYYTTPSDVITLSETTPSKTLVNFKQHTTLGTITPIGADGLTIANNNISFNIYPNPASRTVNLQWASLATGNATFDVTDMTGRVVLKKGIDIYSTSGETRIDISSLESGIYFVNMRSGPLTYCSKLLVNH